MTFYLTTTRKNAMLDSLTTAAGTTATVKIYSGAVPASADAAPRTEVESFILQIRNGL